MRASVHVRPSRHSSERFRAQSFLTRSLDPAPPASDCGTRGLAPLVGSRINTADDRATRARTLSDQGDGRRRDTREAASGAGPATTRGARRRSGGDHRSRPHATHRAARANETRPNNASRAAASGPVNSGFIVPTRVRGDPARGVGPRRRPVCVRRRRGRCSSTAFLEIHHVLPFAAGGQTVTENLSLRGRAHNGLEAEKFFGERVRRSRREKRQRATHDSSSELFARDTTG